MYRPYGDYAMAIAPYVRQIQDYFKRNILTSVELFAEPTIKVKGILPNP